MLEHITNIKTYGIVYDLNLTTINTIIILAKKKYINPSLTGNPDDEGIAIPDEIFKLFFSSIKEIKRFINLINMIKGK